MTSAPIRAFIAIELPSEIQLQLDDVMKRLRSARALAVRWVPTGNIHLTIKFLGDTQPEALTQLKGLLHSAAARHSQMTFVVGGIGAFPNVKNPRVIWVGLESPPQMTALFKAVETAAAVIGVPPEARGFSPHLTLGRVQKNASRAEIEGITSALSSVSVGELGKFQACGITLFRSDLRPSGSVYTSLAYFKFTE